MWTMKNILLLVLLAVTAWFIFGWSGMARRARERGEKDPAESETLYHSIVGFVMCFLDTLGIGNFATTTSAFKFRSTVPDEKIPGTLNVGYALPTVAQAFIYISIVEVDVWTLVLLIVASVAGAWLGAGVVARWSRRNVQIGMGVALLVAAVLFALKALNVGPPEGSALELRGALLAAGLVGNFALGALMTLGIGLYGPCLIMISLLGMNPKAAFPIMMGSCAFLMPIGGIRFIREGSYSMPAAVIMTLSGIPAVVIAAKLVTWLPRAYMFWLVVVVVVYAAAMMLRSAASEARRGAAAAPGES
jgi:uncharacterized membrane protein YfcA